MKAYSLILILISVFIPKLVFGQMIITEIMYDLEGVDTGREWIELKNIGSESVDLSVWKLYEGESNHALNLFKGSDSLVTVDEYVVVADNAEKFMADWPEFGGTVFDSSFSLKQGGEILIIRDDELSDIDQVEYLPDWGAGGDGNSLQLVNGKWLAGLPTPGAPNVGDVSTTNPDEEASVITQTFSSSGASLPFPVVPQIYALSSGDKTGVAGGIVNFEGIALGLKKEPLTNARFIWNFGDGSSKEGKNVAHTYNYPGDYVVFLDVSSGEYSTASRMEVKITEAKLKISSAKIGFSGELVIELYNDSDEEVNISYWLLGSGNTFFAFPNNSIMKAKSRLTFPYTVTNLKIGQSKKINLLYPNGSTFYSYDTNPGVNNSNPSKVYKAEVINSNIIDLSKNKEVVSTRGEKNEDPSDDTLTKGNDGPLNEGELASVISFSNTKNNSSKWIFFIVGFSAVGVLGAMFIRRFSKSA